MTAKLKIIIHLIGALLIAQNADVAAAPGDVYLGVNALNITAADQSGDIDNQLDARGLNARVVGYDDSRHGWGINGYLLVAPLWGVELGYVNLGEVDVKFDGVAADVDTFLSSTDDLHPVTANGTTLALVGQHTFARRFALHAKGGFFFWRSEYDLRGGTETKHLRDNGTGAVYGAELRADITQQIQAGLGLQIYTVEGQRSRAVNFGLTYRFPGLGARLRTQTAERTITKGEFP